MRAGFDWVFRSRRTGRITIGQFPNVALWLFIVTVVVRRFVADGTAPRTAVNWIGIAALAWWAIDEVLRGVNPWRRLLGLACCASLIAALVA